MAHRKAKAHLIWVPEQGQGGEIPTSNTNHCARSPQTPHEANSGTSLATSRTPQHLLHSKRKTCRNAPTAGQAATPNSRTPGHCAAHPARSLGPPGHPPTPPTDPPLALTCFARSGALLAAAALAPMPVAAKPSPPVAGPSTCPSWAPGALVRRHDAYECLPAE